MTVYVDDMRARYGRMVMCHMIADTDRELHTMADAVGARRAWFQNERGRPHYDLSLTRRTEAVRRGAREITRRQAAMMTAVRKATGCIPTPDTAKTFFGLLRRPQQHSFERIQG